MGEQVRFRIGALQFSGALDTILSENFDRHYSCFYNKNSASLLNGLCDKYGSDKGELTSVGHPYPWPSHSYADYIERIFGHCRQNLTKVFECGLGTNNPKLPSSMGAKGRPGASLRVWRDYFPAAQIIGVDVDKDILFEEERIATYHCDQTDPASIKAMWDRCGITDFDLMIDDGLHTFNAGRILFENCFDRLREGGLYIIEDVSVSSLLDFRAYFEGKPFRYEFVTLYRSVVPLGDNSLVVIRK